MGMPHPARSVLSVLATVPVPGTCTSRLRHCADSPERDLSSRPAATLAESVLPKLPGTQPMDTLHLMTPGVEKKRIT
jgi:hypothetical protein